MEKTITYSCEECRKTVQADSAERAPECCGEPMKPLHPLEPCTAAPHHEMSRNDWDDDACDDGRG
ncbi:MAG: hypothetical protein JXA20_09575 [Spirochaetes bacterium]|nr:hypothetical protein [Spirochaetota bacterium]